MGKRSVSKRETTEIIKNVFFNFGSESVPFLPSHICLTINMASNSTNAMTMIIIERGSRAHSALSPNLALKKRLLISEEKRAKITTPTMTASVPSIPDRHPLLLFLFKVLTKPSFLSDKNQRSL